MEEDKKREETLDKFQADSIKDAGYVTPLCKFMRNEPEAMFALAMICKKNGEEQPEWITDVPHLMKTVSEGIDKFKAALDDFDDLLEHLPQSFLMFIGFTKIVRIMIPGVQDLSSCCGSTGVVKHIYEGLINKDASDEA